LKDARFLLKDARILFTVARILMKDAKILLKDARIPFTVARFLFADAKIFLKDARILNAHTYFKLAHSRILNAQGLFVVVSHNCVFWLLDWLIVKRPIYLFFYLMCFTLRPLGLATCFFRCMQPAHALQAQRLHKA
jgi:hypothetical protein